MMLYVTYTTSNNILAGFHKTQTAADDAATADTSITAYQGQVNVPHSASIGEGYIDPATGDVSSENPISDLEALRNEALEAEAWTDNFSARITEVGRKYGPGPTNVALAGEAQAIKGLRILMFRSAPTVAGLTVAQRRTICSEWIKGFSNASTAEELFVAATQVAVQRTLQGLTPVLRTPESPLSWVNPLVDPIVRVSVGDVIDFSGSGSGNLNLLSSHISPFTDYADTSWIDNIPGDIPGIMFDTAMDTPVIPSGSTETTGTLTWSTPADSGSAITAIEVQHAAGTTEFTGDPTSLSASDTTYTFSGLELGQHRFRARGVNANGNGMWRVVTVNVTQAS